MNYRKTIFRLIIFLNVLIEGIAVYFIFLWLAGKYFSLSFELSKWVYENRYDIIVHVPLISFILYISYIIIDKYVIVKSSVSNTKPTELSLISIFEQIINSPKTFKLLLLVILVVIIETIILIFVLIQYNEIKGLVDLLTSIKR